MKVTSAYANKLIRGYREELAAIVSNERDTCTTTYGASETPIETGYNFTSTQDEMDAFVSGERNAFQFSEYGEKIISDEDRKHSDSLQRARNFMKKKNSADYGPERRTCADRRCNGDRQFAHCIIDAGPTGCHKDGLCQDQEPVMRFGDDGG